MRDGWRHYDAVVIRQQRDKVLCVAASAILMTGALVIVVLFYDIPAAFTLATFSAAFAAAGFFGGRRAREDALRLDAAEVAEAKAAAERAEKFRHRS
jgi:hypothetical protein